MQPPLVMSNEGNTLTQATAVTSSRALLYEIAPSSTGEPVHWFATFVHWTPSKSADTSVVGGKLFHMHCNEVMHFL